MPQNRSSLLAMSANADETAAYLVDVLAAVAVVIAEHLGPQARVLALCHVPGLQLEQRVPAQDMQDTLSL